MILGTDVEDTLYVGIAICGFSLQLYLKGALCSFGADILVRRERWTWTDFIILKKKTTSIVCLCVHG